ncbi:DUF1515 domain-containing protein [Mesorhizobium sp. M0757]|uniref:DUF1515 family protein n=1 Tax=Mesorhizobium sp. M0757 TaxID=2956993 RepID=UPI0033390893
MAHNENGARLCPMESLIYMAISVTKSLEMMVGGLIAAMEGVHRDATEIRRDIEHSDARAVRSYEQSEQRAAASCKDVRQDRRAGWSGLPMRGETLSEDMTEVKAVTAEVTRWKLMNLGALGVMGWRRRL